MHGFNRLGGNSVAETVVAGMIVGEFIADFCDNVRERRQHPDRRSCATSSRASRPSSTRLLERRRHEDATAIKAAHAGDHDRQGRHLPHRAGPRAAVDELQKLLVRSRNIGVRSQRAGRQSRARDGLPRAEDAEARALRRLRRARRAPKAAARTSARTSRAATTPQWLKRTLATWKERARHAADARLRAARRRAHGAAAGLARLWRQGLRRPPRHRRAQAEVDAARSSKDGDRASSVQHALMPYEHLLPQAASRAQRTHRRALA